MGVEWFNHHKGGFRGEAVPTDIHTNTDTTCKERRKEGGVTTTSGGSGERGNSSDRPEVFHPHPTKVGVGPFRGRGNLTTPRFEGGGLCAKH